MTKVVALKEALYAAEAKVATKHIERGKQDAWVGEVQQELQELGKKFESLEHDFKTQESELAKALQSATDAKAEAQKALQEIQVAKKIAEGKAFLCKASMWRRHFFYLPEFGALQGHSQICHAAYRMPWSSTVLKRGAQRRSCSGPNILEPNTQCL